MRSGEKNHRCKDTVYEILPPKIVVRGLCVSCVGGVGEYCIFWMEDSCVMNSASGVYKKVSSWEIILGWLIGMVIEEVELGLVCL